MNELMSVLNLNIRQQYFSFFIITCFRLRESEKIVQTGRATHVNVYIFSRLLTFKIFGHFAFGVQLSSFVKVVLHIVEFVAQTIVITSARCFFNYKYPLGAVVNRS